VIVLVIFGLAEIPAEVLASKYLVGAYRANRKRWMLQEENPSLWRSGHARASWRATGRYSVRNRGREEDRKSEGVLCIVRRATVEPAESLGTAAQYLAARLSTSWPFRAAV
jgi:hypothetical protein